VARAQIPATGRRPEHAGEVAVSCDAIVVILMDIHLLDDDPKLSVHSRVVDDLEVLGSLERHHAIVAQLIDGMAQRYAW
jgi:hypothetical protein